MKAAFDELTLKRIDNSVGALCRSLTRPEHAHELAFEYEVSGQAVSIFEVRPNWRGEGPGTRSGVARFRYVRARHEWSLYWMRADLKWHLYRPDEASSKELADLVRVVQEDREGAFFG